LKKRNKGGESGIAFLYHRFASRRQTALFHKL